MHRALLVLVLATAPALADERKIPAAEARVELSDVIAEYAMLTGKVIKIPGPLDTKPSELYTCGHDKKHWVAFEIIDRGKSIIGYCTFDNWRGCKRFSESMSIMHVVAKVPKCKETVVEVLTF